ncbi:hypothetical protein PR048_010405 [Dryococelus australis]|uniref:Uncharacterized protein n=1 Tax=Dryococelus australis TaxID=614101 RepID=A0ABQ9I2P0_9NEOP|nr:hypothetical protein PR048_010405 [Dryococelus australis]
MVVRQNVLLKLNLGDHGSGKDVPKHGKRNVAKRARHRPKGLPKKPICEHGNKRHFRCKDLSLQDIRRIRQKFYQQPDHEWQNNFLLQHVSVVTPKRSCTSAGSSKSSQTNTFCYVWTENEFSKGSNQIASAVPPPDRIFVHLERELHSRSVIETPDEYVKVIKKQENLRRRDAKKPCNLTFSIPESKENCCPKSKTNTSALVLGEPFYNFEGGEPKSLCKRGKIFCHTQIPNVPKGVPVKPAKLCNVKRLLVIHLREERDNNPKLELFKNVFEEESFPTQGQNEDEESDELLDFDSTR